MTVSWNANSNPADITEYTVVFSTGDTYNTYDGNIELSTKPIGTPIYASIATLSANTTYYLYVNAVSHNGVSTDYAALGSTVTHVIPPASAVSTFTAVMTNSLTAHWDANGNGDGTLYEPPYPQVRIFPILFQTQNLLTPHCQPHRLKPNLAGFGQIRHIIYLSGL